MKIKLGSSPFPLLSHPINWVNKYKEQTRNKNPIASSILRRSRNSRKQSPLNVEILMATCFPTFFDSMQYERTTILLHFLFKVRKVYLTHWNKWFIYLPSNVRLYSVDKVKDRLEVVDASLVREDDQLSFQLLNRECISNCVLAAICVKCG